jgi:hypothetical protein
MNKNTLREVWLNRAVDLLQPVFDGRGYEIPPCRVSVGFPSMRALTATSCRIGECWDKEASADKIAQIFISPLIDDVTGPAGVLAILAHELIHVIFGSVEGHGKKFGACARAIGLEGKLTSTTAGPELQKQFRVIAKSLGAYPHSKLNPARSGRKKQTTRLIKCECMACGFVARTTRKWIEDAGAPHCPKHGEMEAKFPEDDGE